MQHLEQFRKIRNTPVDPNIVKTLGYPEGHVLLSAKLFEELVARIEALEARQQPLNCIGRSSRQDTDHSW
jgi:hypothetical protein